MDLFPNTKPVYYTSWRMFQSPYGFFYILGRFVKTNSKNMLIYDRMIRIMTYYLLR